MVFLDIHDGAPKFFITTVSEARQLVADQKAGASSPRPVTLDSRHCCIRPDQVSGYRDAWQFYTRAV